jgi:hypothetical protein
MVAKKYHPGPSTSLVSSSTELYPLVIFMKASRFRNFKFFMKYTVIEVTPETIIYVQP